MNNPAEIERIVRQMQGSLEQINRTVQTVATLGNAVAQLQASTAVLEAAPLPPIIQIFRNTDFTYSINSYFNATNAVGDQQEECAYYFAHAPDEQKTFYDGKIDAGTTSFESPISAPFAPADAGKTIIIDGAGEDGQPFVATIATYTNSGAITLSAPTPSAVNAARFRFGCVKLEKKTTKDGADAVNDALKAASHSHYADNIQSPDWKKETGIVRLGGKNTLTSFHGFYDADNNFFPQIPPFRAGNEMWVLFKLARTNPYIKLKGYLYAGIWDNSPTALEYLRASDFDIEAIVPTQDPSNPFATATAQYFVVSVSDTGKIYKSRVKTVPNAPTENSFNPPTAQVSLSWAYIPGIIGQRIYRKIGTGNVFLLETVTNGVNRYIDGNPARRTDTGTTDFPTIDATTTNQCIARTDDFAQLTADGFGDWKTMFLQIPVPPTTNFSLVTELAIRIGLTEDAVLEFAGAVNGTQLMSTGGFTKDLTGKAVFIRFGATQNLTHAATVAACVSPNELTLSAPCPFTSDQIFAEIIAPQDYALLIDVLGVSLNQGRWAKHPDDDTRALPVDVLPPVTSQGGGTSTGGGINCFLPNSIATLSTRDQIHAGDLKAGDLLYYGRTDAFNRIKKVTRSTIYYYFQVVSKTYGKTTSVTQQHRFVRASGNSKTGTPLGDLKTSAIILLTSRKFDKFDSIDSIELISCPQGIEVISIELEFDETRPDECFLFDLDGFLMHNNKSSQIEGDGGGYQPQQTTF